MTEFVRFKSVTVCGNRLREDKLVKIGEKKEYLIAKGSAITNINNDISIKNNTIESFLSQNKDPPCLVNVTYGCRDSIFENPKEIKHVGTIAPRWCDGRSMTYVCLKHAFELILDVECKPIKVAHLN